jgi:hypothetical protein
MKAPNIILPVLVGLLTALGMAGCEMDESNPDGSNAAGFTGNIKTHGVYTTLAIPDAGLDLPASGYLEKNSFGPGEMPEAVITGYGTYEQQQSVTLELIEADTGRSLFSRDYYASYGKVLMQPLAIRLSGNYELKLTSGGAPLDACEFTVARTNSSGIIKEENANPGTSYGRGIFSVSMGPDDAPGFFAKYDEKLIYTMVNSVTEEAGNITNLDLFAQRFPGKVVMQCRLDFQGRLTAPKVQENTLDDDCTALFKKILLDRSPYDAWPEDVHQKFGTDYRDLTLTINFD